MTGTPAVSNLPLWYQLSILLCLSGFALYDLRRHLVKNCALAVFCGWCLLSLCLFPCRTAVLSAIFGFLSGGLLLLTISLCTGGGIGGGDIKMVSVLGILYGASGILLLTGTAAFLALIWISICRVLRHQKERLAFVPWLFFAALLMRLLPM